MDLIIILCGGIMAILIGRAIYVVRSEKQMTRGTEPGHGVVEIKSEYASGVGGGEYRTYSVPKNPDNYAQMFVPKDRK